MPADQMTDVPCECGHLHRTVEQDWTWFVMLRCASAPGCACREFRPAAPSPSAPTVFTPKNWRLVAHRWRRRAHQTAATVRRMAAELRARGIEPDPFNPGMYGPITPTPSAPEVEGLTRDLPAALRCMALECETHAAFYREHGENSRARYAAKNAADLVVFASAVAALTEELRVAREDRDKSHATCSRYLTAVAGRVGHGGLDAAYAVEEENARLRTDLAALRRTQGEDTRDAERYRFLRDNGLRKTLRSRAPGLMELALGPEWDEAVYKTGMPGGRADALIDTAIDAARRTPEASATREGTDA